MARRSQHPPTTCRQGSRRVKNFKRLSPRVSTIRRAVLLLLLLIIGFGAHPSLGRAEVPEASSSARTSLLAPDSFITLDRAIRIALEHHPALEQTRYNSLAAQAITKQRKGDRYPW